MNDQEIVRSLSIRIVTNNHAEPPLRQEHGLSLWIEANSHVILFDTGQGPALSENFPPLGLLLSRIDSVVLSHGHYDHSGGLAAVMEAKGKVPVFLHPKAMQERFSRRGGEPRSIGLPEASRAALKSNGSDVVQSEGPVCICPGVWATGAIPRTNVTEGADENLYLADGSPDTVVDDQAVWIRTFQGIVVLLGCCHAGVINTLDYVNTLTHARIRAVIGGMHLSHADPVRWGAVEKALLRHQVKQVIPCHCTGEKATNYLAEKLGDRCKPGKAGDLISFQ
jgi:7,8-dihydropterin-6-yl-methyl-4-(beta-D-ribofuranosyl)aminobenzene 5'-phosphate synthase